MANFEVPEEPEFNTQIRKLEESDPAHANLFNAIIESLLNNELFLKKVQDALVESLKEHLKNETNPHKVTKEQVGVPQNAVFTDTTYEVFKAPNTNGIGAKAGLVPAPTVADIPKVLGGGGTWVPASEHTHDDYAVTSHTHTASDIGALPQDGTATKSNAIHVPRVTKNPSSKNDNYTLSVEEYSNSSEGVPNRNWYYIYTSQGGDQNYASQLAIGMTVDDMYFRTKQNGTWGNWIKLLHSENAVPKSGGIFTGSITTQGYLIAGNATYGNKVVIYSSNEGGNIQIIAPDSYNKYWEIDAYNGNLRIYQHDNNKNANYFPLNITSDTVAVNKLSASGGITGSLTGNASTATALTTSAGSNTLPVYFNKGKPVVCDGYYPGDYDDFSWWGSGVLTNANKSIYFTVTLGTPISGSVNKIELSDVGIILRQNNSYLKGSGNTTCTTGFTVSVGRLNFNMIHVTVTFSTSIGGTNNECIGVFIEGVLRFKQV